MVLLTPNKCFVNCFKAPRLFIQTCEHGKNVWDDTHFIVAAVIYRDISFVACQRWGRVIQVIANRSL